MDDGRQGTSVFNDEQDSYRYGGVVKSLCELACRKLALLSETLIN
jgi:hypothetical protein